MPLACDFSGAPEEIRTPDTRFRKPVLYPLSYEGVRHAILASCCHVRHELVEESSPLGANSTAFSSPSAS